MVITENYSSNIPAIYQKKQVRTSLVEEHKLTDPRKNFHQQNMNPIGG